MGKKRWNLRLGKAIELLDRVINFDHLYIGGGNGKKVTIALPSHATIISNTAGLLGGIALWADPNVSPSTCNRASWQRNGTKTGSEKKFLKNSLEKKEMTHIHCSIFRLLHDGLRPPFYLMEISPAGSYIMIPLRITATSFGWCGWLFRLGRPIRGFRLL